jgi:hypothetical protein
METAEQKKIKSNIKRRETNYRARGLKIISGNDALSTIKNSENYSLLAVDTDYWTSIEFVETNNLDDKENVDIYLYRFLSNGNICKKLRFSNDKTFTDFVCQTKWAVKKAGREIITLGPNDR